MRVDGAQGTHRPLAIGLNRHAITTECALTPRSLSRVRVRACVCVRVCATCAQTSADHGDGNNHGQLNALNFVAPERIRLMYEANPQLDMGVWEQEQGELLLAIRPRLEIIFNSASGHACM